MLYPIRWAQVAVGLPWTRNPGLGSRKSWIGRILVASFWVERVNLQGGYVFLGWWDWVKIVDRIRSLNEPRVLKVITKTLVKLQRTQRKKSLPWNFEPNSYITAFVWTTTVTVQSYHKRKSPTSVNNILTSHFPGCRQSVNTSYFRGRKFCWKKVSRLSRTAKLFHFAGINFRGWKIFQNLAGINFLGTINKRDFFVSLRYF